MLDADGDGALTAVDGQLIVRDLAGIPAPQPLTGITLAPGATRTTAATILDHLDDFLPPVAAPMNASVGVTLASVPALLPAEAAGESTSCCRKVAYPRMFHIDSEARRADNSAPRGSRALAWLQPRTYDVAQCRI